MSDVSLRTKAWFGDDILAIDFPPSWKVVEVGPSDTPALTLRAMQEALGRPIGFGISGEVAGA